MFKIFPLKFLFYSKCYLIAAVVMTNSPLLQKVQLKTDWKLLWDISDLCNNHV